MRCPGNSVAECQFRKLEAEGSNPSRGLSIKGATSATPALSGLKVQRYAALTRNEYKSGKADIRLMDRTYLNNGEYRVASELRMVDRELPEPNRSYAIGYKEYLELNNRKGKTIARRLGELRFILKSLNKDARQADRRDTEQVVMAINKGKRRDQNGKGTSIDLASITKRKLKQNLRSFYKWLYGKDEYPDIVKWVKVGTEVKNKLPEEMLNEEEIKKLIEVCRNQRDKTIIALLWDTGMRIGELLNLKIKDISLTENISHVRVSGKTGDRQVPSGLFRTIFCALFE